MTTGPKVGGEEAIIQGFLAPLAAGYAGAFGLRDDCAAYTPTPGHDLIVKTDPIAEGVHFSADDAPEDIGWKALAVNASDLAAKGATPRAYLMALSFPAAPTRDWMQRFAQGLGDAQVAFGMHLIGGDTDRRPGPITVSITVFGEVPIGTMVRRGTAKAGDLLYVSGSLGSAAVGLAVKQDPSLATAWALDTAELDELTGRLYRPQPRLGLTAALRAHASAAMDLSDGLAKDLDRMCRASGVGAVVRLAAVPMSAGVARVVAADPKRWSAVVASGDDYEVLATIAPENAAAFKQAARLAAPDIPISCIGAIVAGSGVLLEQADGAPLALDRTGWEHF
jgi:thiamine-monophosphate kinase